MDRRFVWTSSGILRELVSTFKLSQITLEHIRASQNLLISTNHPRHEVLENKFGIRAKSRNFNII
jgi:hypothetical protein